ncbi:hypothetical protein BV898_16941 [Hypsibius exemplaris]|uniref:Uncharacterized protein n=1 Tax=Hypsibius exemplaris TaxID=2072580 RepID=A0A9X6RLN8_HYPEX|nr:hypothetical protein BV898_16941 [Hypsibius exemplaris]
MRDLDADNVNSDPIEKSRISPFAHGFATEIGAESTSSERSGRIPHFNSTSGFVKVAVPESAPAPATGMHHVRKMQAYSPTLQRRFSEESEKMVDAAADTDAKEEEEDLENGDQVLLKPKVSVWTSGVHYSRNYFYEEDFYLPGQAWKR